jgi:hypothetical protein
MYYAHWGNILSLPFNVQNGVRQGGILSPQLFNLYMNGLSKSLHKHNIGLYTGNFSNHIMYADDLVLYSPSVKGLEELIIECEHYGKTHDIKYNSKKSAVMIVKSAYDNVDGHAVPNVTSVKYLGHIINEYLSDDEDINRQKGHYILKLTC